jgi:hypothetical protein
MGMPPQGMSQGMHQGMPPGMPYGMPPGMMNEQVSSQPRMATMPAPAQQREEPRPAPQKPNIAPSATDGLNIDALVKKIDAKIAELEEEEKRNTDKVQKKAEDDKLEVIGDKESAIIHKENLSTSLELDDSDDDDDFFDDFFDN